MILILGFLVAFVTTALIILPVRRWAVENEWVDKPDHKRKLHERATPTIGGLAIAAGFVVALLYVLVARHFSPFDIRLPAAALWAGALVMVLTGFYDDVKNLGFKRKFALQLVAAYLMMHAGYRIDLSALPFVGDNPYNEALYSMPLTLLWVVGVINAVNLLDGLDGLAAGVVMIGFVGLATIFGMHGDVSLVLIALLMAGALAGFLLHNFNPASIFMGDSGSLFLGYMLAAYSLSGKAHTDPMLALLVPVMALGLPIMDTGLSIVRRTMEKKSAFAPDSDHIHHRLARQGSVRRAVLTLYVVAFTFSVAAVAMALSTFMVGLGVAAGVLLVAYVWLRSLGYLAKPEGRPLSVEARALEDRVGQSRRGSTNEGPLCDAAEPRTDEKVSSPAEGALFFVRQD